MGQKTVRFSDLSGQLITEESALARVVVHEHPELGDSPVEFEALIDEAMVLEKSALRVAVVELHLPGGETPRRVAMEAEAFDRMATDKPMSELLITARPVRRPTRSANSGGSRASRADYATLEHAGEPHKGRVNDLEKQLVRDHLDEINDRLVAQGLRTISLTDPEHVERYGLEDLARQQAAGRAGAQQLEAQQAEAPELEAQQAEAPQRNGRRAGREALAGTGDADSPADPEELAAEMIDVPVDDVDIPLDPEDLPERQVSSRSRSRRR